MKKYYIIFAIFISFLFTNQVKASSIDSINMDIYVDKNGNANIEETYKANVTEGTEGYHPYFNLGNSTIEFNSVTDDLGNNYSVKDWDINDSFGTKAKKFGVYKTGDEVDLCWGITKYGNRTYKLNYKINNFIYKTTDEYQVLYWTLIPKGLSSSPGKVYIKIHSDEAYSKELPVWGYGNYGGIAYVYDGYIEFQSDGSLGNEEYMTLLVKYPKDTFTTDNKIDKSFDDFFKMAEKGATHYKENKKSPVIGYITFGIIFFVFGLIGYGSYKVAKYNLIQNKKIDKKRIFRDLPFKDNYELAFYIASEYNLYKRKTDYLGAVILKFIKDGNITIEGEGKNTILHLIKEPENEFDKKLYAMLVEASNRSGEPNTLEKKEFKKYCSEKYKKVLNWFDDILLEKKTEIENNKEYVEIKKDKHSKDVKYATNLLNESASNLYGLKNFFFEFSSIDDKKAIEVKLWRDYLIYAQLLGMAKTVAKQFKNLYPDVITDTEFDNYIYITSFSSDGVSSASVARSRAEGYSSGGGGFSSGGGGGGSFGGGGGGGGFR